MDWPIVTVAATNQDRPVTHLYMNLPKNIQKEIWMTTGKEK